jgi:putative ABC transport system permease protein
MRGDLGRRLESPLPQFPWTLLYLSARAGAGDAHAPIPPVRRAVAAVDREQPLTKVLTGEELLESATVQPRFTAWLMAAFSLAAFAIAAAGIYAIVAYSVAQRRHEIGVRIAVGAARHDVFRLVIGGGLRLAVLGVLLGLSGAFMLARLLASLYTRPVPPTP